MGKKIITLMLSMIMVFGMVTTAFATETTIEMNSDAQWCKWQIEVDISALFY